METALRKGTRGLPGFLSYLSLCHLVPISAAGAPEILRILFQAEDFRAIRLNPGPKGLTSDELIESVVQGIPDVQKPLDIQVPFLEPGNLLA